MWPLIFTIVALSLVGIKADDADILILRYKGIDRSELAGLMNDRYGFVFCSCKSPTFNPSESDDCDCGREVIGKTAMESMSQALYSSACIYNPDPRKCLFSSFRNREVNDYYYVRVSLGGGIISNPIWQQLRSSRHKAYDTITTTFRTRIDVTYMILPKAENTNTIAPSRGAAHTTPPSTKYKKSRPASKKPKKVLKSVLIAEAKTTKSTTNDKSWMDKYFPKNKQRNFEKEKTVKLAPPTPVATPHYLPAVQRYGRVQQITDMNQVRDFLLREGLRAGQPAYLFDSEEFKSRITTHHNLYRARHGLTSLAYDRNLEAYAQRWADTLGNLQECLVHENPKNYGENLFWFAARNFPDADLFAETVTQAFYLEGLGYNYQSFNPGSFHRVGHFTQLIWKESRRMGVGIAIRNFNGRRTKYCHPNVPLPMIYVVIKYDPPGNVQSYNSYMRNVVPPLFKN